MSLFLLLSAYAAVIYILARAAWRVWLFSRAVPDVRPDGYDASGVRSISGWVVDIVLLRRLMRQNSALWAGQWVLHMSFVFLFIRHLRYVVSPVPGAVSALQGAGVVAGYIMVCSILYIAVYKLVFECGKYQSLYNLFLTIVIVVIGASGLALRWSQGLDLAGVKRFVIGVVSLRLEAAPGDTLFAVHYVTGLIFLAMLPAHVFSAWLTTHAARERDLSMKRVLHD